MSAQINLYNPALRMRREYVTGATLLLGLVIVVLALAGAYGYEQSRVASLTRDAAATETMLKDRQSELTRLAEEVKQRGPTKKTALELASAELLLQGHEEVAAALDGGLIGTTAGFSAFLRALARQIVPGVWLTSLSIDTNGSGMSIAGRALDPELLPSYIQRLNQEPVMQGRAFASLELTLPQGEKTGKNAPVGPNYHEFVLQAVAPGGRGSATDARPAAETDPERPAEKDLQRTAETAR